MPRIAAASAGSMADLLVFVAPTCLVAAVVVPVNQATQRSGAVSVASVAEPELPRTGLPSGSYLEVGTDAPLTLVAQGLPYSLSALTDAWLSVTLLTVGLAGLLLWRVLRAVAAGDPFRPPNALLVLGLAVVTAVGGTGAQVAEWWAADAVLGHLGLSGAGSPVAPWYELSLVPLLLAALLVILADAIRTGARMRADLDGLV
jgi:Protein of unknown function (DUF2975)